MGGGNKRLINFLNENNIQPEDLKIIPHGERNFLVLYYGRKEVCPEISDGEIKAKFWGALGNP